MVAPFKWEADDEDGHRVVAVRGSLDMGTAATLRTALLKQLADQPEALLVDLSAMTVADRTALTVFTAVVRQAAMWPGAPVVLCAPAADAVASLASGRYGALPMHGSTAEAHRAVRAGTAVAPSVIDDLLPLPGAARHARNLATEACVRWSLPHLIGPASIVTSELVSNAIDHAGTMMNLRLTRRPRYLHIAVRDGSTTAPRRAALPDPSAPGGRGLHLVASMAVRWGSLPSEAGKVVWATLATGEPTPGAGPRSRLA